jgi:hypothetical protein
MHYSIKEAIKIRLHPRNFNRDRGFNLCQSQYPVINMIKKYQVPSTQRQDQDKRTYDPTH